MKFLIIDDDPILATSLKFQLTKITKCDILIVDNAISAKNQLLIQKFDLVFCDIRMPQIDGVTLLSEFIDVGNTRGVIIMSSADDEILSLTRGMCNLIGFRYVNILKKPFDSRNLELILEDFSRQSSVRVQDSVANSLAVIDIQSAFDEDRIFVLYQPQFDFRTGKLVGVETLVRMQYQGEVYLPSAFLGLIEEMGYSEKLFEVVLQKATSALAMISTDIRLSVNITKDLLETDICDRIISICHKNAFPLSKLCLELTEEQAYNATPKALANLARMRLNSIELSLDDFGKDYASLEQLVDLPLSEIKMDKYFIQGITEDYKRQQLTFMSLQLAQSLGLNFVAEGVEDEDTWDYMRALGADKCQGFYLSKAICARELQDMTMLLKDGQLSDEYELGVTIVYYAPDTIESSAFYKLLNKEIDNSNVMWVSSNDVFRNTVRDLPIDAMVIDDSLASEINILDSYNARCKKFIMASLANFEAPFSDENTSVIVKHKLLHETVKSLFQKIVIENESESLAKVLMSKLSKRELAVAKMLVAGFTNKYISYELDINQKTVSTYKTRVLSKLGVKNTVELVKLFGGSPV